jgi:hypothetical protein
MNKDALDPKPNAGAKKISKSGTAHPMIIQKRCLFISNILKVR